MAKTVYNRATGKHEKPPYDMAKARREGKAKGFFQQVIDDLQRSYNPTDQKLGKAMKEAMSGRKKK